METAGAGGRLPLHEGWTLASTAPGAVTDPRALADAVGLDWRAAVVPGTVAQALGVSLDEPGAAGLCNAPLDSKDWWYRTRFDALAASDTGAPLRLRFAGLATLADVWLNGEPLLSARNMFVPHAADVTGRLRPVGNELVIRFRALDAELALRKPRPRWKTALVAQQNLRWVRTTLLGRIPGWSPPIQAVGPWQEITLEALTPARVEHLDLTTSVRGGIPHLRVRAQTAGVTGSASQDAVVSARLIAGKRALELRADGAAFGGEFEMPEAPLWWPATHGTPALVPCRLELRTASGQVVTHDAGRIGFKSVELDRAQGRVSFRINGEPVFCRGACWTTADMITLTGDTDRLRALLTAARDGGLNMLRVGGTMTYETDAFYALCDELGILVWQDFMFANFDYPVADPDFAAEIAREADHQLGRLQKYACLAVYCGGSEVQQQAAMLGLPREAWSNDFFDRTLPAACAARHPGIPYFPSSPCEGALPFHVAEGITHYYGVGAYRRPLAELKHAGVKFTPECLGFSNVPEYETAERLSPAGSGVVPPPHTPAWKARVPRDSGAGWDFEDVRDHYLRELHGQDPVELRSQDPDRYYELSRAVTGEVMRTAYAEWRRSESVCGGGLVWFFNDLWPGAGWGVFDSLGKPKPVWHWLKRAWAPQTVLMTDEGLDGLRLHVHNETATPLEAVVNLELYSRSRIRTAAPERALTVSARGRASLGSDELLGHFADVNHAYRFGPAKYDVARASLRDAATGKLIAEDFFFPQGHDLPDQEPESVTASAAAQPDGRVILTVRSRVVLQAVHFSAKEYVAAENWFHLAPEHEKQVVFHPLPGTRPRAFKAELNALNLHGGGITVRAETVPLAAPTSPTPGGVRGG